MQSYRRTFSLTLALILATAACLLVVAAPQHDAAGEDVSSGTTPPTKPLPPPNRDESGPPSAPITFADPDGQELILEELSARTVVHGMLSLTELELRFRNPQSRVIEGRFTCTLPPNAAISRFAKEVNGHLMEGEVVERLRANQVYEQFLHRMRDPALLEQDQGNRFSARIFPIEPNAPVRLLVSYTMLLPMRDGVRTYTLPLRGIQKVKKLTFRAFATPVPGEQPTGKLTTSSAEVTRFDERDWTPDRDVVLTWRAAADAPASRVLRGGDFYIAALRPDAVPMQRAATSGDWLFYVDTSASSAEGASHRIRAIEQLLAALPPQDRVELVAFDQEIAPLARGSAAELSRTAGARLRARLFLGGTDLGALLRDMSHRLSGDGGRTVVVASDLAATLGATAGHELKDAIAAIPRRAAVHALILGSREDAATAKALTAGRGRIVRVPFTESLATRAREAAGELRRPLGGSIDVSDTGAEWLYPTRFDDVHPGDEILVLGKVKAGRTPELQTRTAQHPRNSGELRGTRGTRGTQQILDASTFGPLLEREAYRAYLEHLAEREASESSDAVRRALATEQVRISVEQRVVIPRTTMLVLESEADYDRFGLDRRALAQILTIDSGGIGRLDRRGQRVTPPPVDRPRPVPLPILEPAMKAAPDAADLRDSAGDSPVAAVAPERAESSVARRITAAGAPAPLMADAESMAFSPPPPIPPPPPRPRFREERRKSDTDWTRRVPPSRERIDELEARLRDDPRDRELYNQLSETLAALGEWAALRRVALRWQPYDPENPQVYEILGMANDGLGNESEAARAYASLIEVAPGKPELLQRAGLLLLRARRGALAETPLRRALEIRPDRANGYRHLALLLWREGRVEEAARLLESATLQSFPGWYGNVHRVLRDELGYIYRAWMKKEPSRRAEIAERARAHEVDLDRRDALRITLAWETDANDVDLHVVDPAGEECFYANPRTRSGLGLYEDITQGLGPEVIRSASVERGTYHIGVRYFAAGPMGISRGLVVVMQEDGGLDIHPFRLTQGGGEIRYVASVKM